MIPRFLVLGWAVLFLGGTAIAAFLAGEVDTACALLLGAVLVTPLLLTRKGSRR